jgi:uncharacterized protein (TIGR02452 family)
MSREKLKSIAEETLKILQSGGYQLNNDYIDISKDLNDCVLGTKTYHEKDLSNIKLQQNEYPQITISNETTVEAIIGLSKDSNDKMAALNFASAKNPGGGFLRGSKAQEEELARSSGLHSSLVTQKEFYDQPKKSGIYTDQIVYSPNCPLFRDNYDALMETLSVDWITSPAPNKSAIEKNNPDELKNLKVVFEKRIENILKVAEDNDVNTLILGAWGCGVFGNDPEMVAQAFKKFVNLKSSIKKIHFAVYDRSDNKDTFNVFHEKLI